MHQVLLANNWKEGDFEQDPDTELKALEYVLRQKAERNKNDTYMDTMDNIFDTQKRIVKSQLNQLNKDLYLHLDQNESRIICLNNMMLEKQKELQIQKEKMRKRQEQEKAINDLDLLLKKVKQKQSILNSTTVAEEEGYKTNNESKITFGDRMRIMSNDQKMFYFFKINRSYLMEYDQQEQYEGFKNDRIRQIKKKFDEDEKKEKLLKKLKRLKLRPDWRTQKLGKEVKKKDFQRIKLEDLQEIKIDLPKIANIENSSKSIHNQKLYKVPRIHSNSKNFDKDYGTKNFEEQSLFISAKPLRNMNQTVYNSIDYTTQKLLDNEKNIITKVNDSQNLTPLKSKKYLNAGEINYKTQVKFLRDKLDQNEIYKTQKDIGEMPKNKSIFNSSQSNKYSNQLFKTIFNNGSQTIQGEIKECDQQEQKVQKEVYDLKYQMFEQRILNESFDQITNTVKELDFANHNIVGQLYDYRMKSVNESNEQASVFGKKLRQVNSYSIKVQRALQEQSHKERRKILQSLTKNTCL
ncbi:UNKNOWN [Stylonychia lemnae]|uniref:Uncharacterized protein n=1 Tax=Stylonychia lemnae TaxID=5949 RepID=A0A078B5C3_STYLE|nr:UNKNOWN [Stylonychia lemnae]|eukprot:CDW88487.1 UNKNOWN [Stylonychia lemnae]